MTSSFLQFEEQQRVRGREEGEREEREGREGYALVVPLVLVDNTFGVNVSSSSQTVGPGCREGESKGESEGEEGKGRKLHGGRESGDG